MNEQETKSVANKNDDSMQPGPRTTEEKKQASDKLDKLDKVYNEMKQKNKKIKKELLEVKNENENLRSIFAEFQVEFRQNKKHEKMFN